MVGWSIQQQESMIVKLHAIIITVAFELESSALEFWMVALEHARLGILTFHYENLTV